MINFSSYVRARSLMIHNFTPKKLNQILKVLGSYQTNGSARKGNKIFSTTLAFSCCLRLSSLSFENAYLLIRFHLLFTLKNDRRFSRHCFQKPSFSPMHTTNRAFSNGSTFRKPSLFSSAFSIVFIVWMIGEKVRVFELKRISAVRI